MIAPAPTPVDSRVGLRDVRVFVGSGVTTVDMLLGEMSALMLQAAGADVRRLLQAGPDGLVREMLLSGEIDLYWESEALAWIAFLREGRLPEDLDSLHAELAERDRRENGVVWIGPTDLFDTQGFAVSARAPDLADVRTLTDMAGRLRRMRGEAGPVCVTGEFVGFREDGRAEFEELLSVAIPESTLRVYDADPIYAATSSGECAFGLVRRLDARSGSPDLRLLVDDVGLFTPHRLAVAVREDVIQSDPRVAAVLARLARELDEDDVRGMLAEVESRGSHPNRVAARWLREAGLTRR
ncbi:MAG: glycine/betaine ABC transporter substrate-binding protein [Acidimicrobiales bacterium]|nr:MAG: glycine/betaine ABC transporter substrate-binding protein [Acidimicrobiales bacterium]